MSSAEMATELRFEPPGTGSWELDPVHFPRPATRYWAETHPEAFKRGVSDFTRFYGMLLGTLEMAYVNGFAYKTARPVAEAEESRGSSRSGASQRVRRSSSRARAPRPSVAVRAPAGSSCNR